MNLPFNGGCSICCKTPWHGTGLMWMCEHAAQLTGGHQPVRAAIEAGEKGETPGG
jgi:hypothetical protein